MRTKNIPKSWGESLLGDGEIFYIDLIVNRQME